LTPARSAFGLRAKRPNSVRRSRKRRELVIGALLCGVSALENLRQREYEAADKQLTYMKHLLSNAERLKKEQENV
jgi:hypothetical protein